MGFFLETAIGGLMAGMLYSLVAIGFVLIYKASGVFNFAHGSLVLFAALAMARFSEWAGTVEGLDSLVLRNLVAIVATLITLLVLAWCIQRWCLSRLVNQKPVTLLMATIGIAYMLDGVGQLVFGSGIYKIDVGMPKNPLILGAGMFPQGILVNMEDAWAAVASVLMVLMLAAFFRLTRWGRALRAVADDQKAALSIGIGLESAWLLVWFLAGLTALVAGVVWGSKLGVQFALSYVALKAIPAVVLGGLTSIPGAIVGSVIVGVGEKLTEVYLGPHVGGGIEIWFAYVLALALLLVRPQGLLGEKIIDRV